MASYAAIESHDFERLCDAIDAVHAGLERENAELRERVAVLDNESGNMHIGSALVTITPTLDRTGVARNLRSIADTLAGDAS
jgi:phosphate uptake regulator